MATNSDQRGDSLPSRIWTVEDYYRAKEFYEKRGLHFNPALLQGSPAAAHVIAQAQLRASAEVAEAANTTAPSTAQPTSAPSEASTGESKRVRNKVFISYSHKDKRFLDQLLAHLKPFERINRVTAWSDKQIQPGSKWFEEIRKALDESRVALLLVSKDFLASDFIAEHELGYVLKEAQQGGVQVLWVPIRACSYHATPLKDIQAVHPPDKPLAEMKAERDRAWVAICKEVMKAATP